MGLKVGVEASSCPTSISAACTICTAMSMSGCNFSVPGCGGINTDVYSYHSVPAGVSWPAGLVAGPWLAASQLVGGRDSPGRLDLLASAEDPTAQVGVSENNSLCPVPLFGPPACMHVLRLGSGMMPALVFALNFMISSAKITHDVCLPYHMWV